MNVTIRPFGENAILLDWPVVIDAQVHQEILMVNEAINRSFSNKIIETVVTYHSICLYLQDNIDVMQTITAVNTFIKKQNHLQTKATKRVVTIPVCYDTEFALDITTVAAKNKLSIEEVIQLHTTPLYPVYFLGFLSGFPYFGGLDDKLHTPRLHTPRLHITAGSVGIGGSQTGIYPSNSPGGWNIIGKTPLKLFDVMASPPNLLNAGELVKFESISLAQFQKIEKDINAGTFQLKTNVL